MQKSKEKYANDKNKDEKLLGIMNDLEQIGILHFVYERDLILFEKYPKALFFQLCSKLLQLCDGSNLISQFLLGNLEKSAESCSLILTHSYLPIMDEMNTKSLAYNKKQFNCLVNCSTANMIFASNTVNLYLISTENYGTLCEMSLVNILLKHDATKKAIGYISSFLVFFRSSVPDYRQTRLNTLKMSDLNCGVIVTVERELFVINFSGEIVFSKCYSTVIGRVGQLSSEHFFLRQKSETFFEIFNTSGKCMVEKHFASTVTTIVSNISVDEAFLPEFNDRPVILFIVLENGEIDVFEFDYKSECLMLIRTFPPLRSSLSCGSVGRQLAS